MKQYILGQLIEELSSFNGDLPVKFDFGQYPNYLCSYRGYYEQLGITYDPRKITVKEFLKELKEADGDTFEGWKGGEYTMNKYSLLFIALRGNIDGRLITSLSLQDGEVIINTIQEPDEYDYQSALSYHAVERYQLELDQKTRLRDVLEGEIQALENAIAESLESKYTYSYVYDSEKEALNAAARLQDEGEEVYVYVNKIYWN